MLTKVVREIVEATGYPANDLLDGIKILPPAPQDEPFYGGLKGQITYTRFERDREGQKVIERVPVGRVETATWLGRADLPEGVWERLELACLADDPSLKGRKLVGGVEIRNRHAYFTPSGEDQQWISNDVIDLS